MNLNAKQVVLIIIAVLSFLATATTNLTELFGPGTAKIIASSATFLNGLIAAAMAPFLSNASTVKDAGQQTGVEMTVNRSAAPAIAALAVDPAQDSIAPAPGEENAVARKATGG